MPKKKYSREFKISAVKLVNEQGYEVREAAASLGIDPQTLKGWVAAFGAEVGKAPADEPAQLRAQLKEAREQVRKLTMEREILKKAAAFFAREQP